MLLTTQSHYRLLPFKKKRKKEESFPRLETKQNSKTKKPFSVWPLPTRCSAGVLFGFALKHTYIRWKAAGLQHNSRAPLRLTSEFLNFTRTLLIHSPILHNLKIQVTFCFNEIENISITKQLAKLWLNTANAFINVQFNYGTLERLVFIFFH